MASAVTTQKFASRNAMLTYDHDPGSTAAMIVSPDGGTTKRYVSLGLYDHFAAMVMATIATGGPTLVDVVAATDAAGTNVTTVVTSGAVAADAVGDCVFVECSAAQVKEVGDAAGFAFTHVGVRITCADVGDECAVTYIRCEPKFPQGGLSANAIS